MDNKGDEIWQIIAREQKGGNNYNDSLKLQEWLNQSDKNRTAYNLLKNIKPVPHQLSANEELETYSLLREKIAIETFRKKKLMLQFVAAASIALMLASFGVLFSAKIKTENPLPTITTQVPHGVKTKIDLPDGSVAIVNSGSSLSYPANFSGSYRKVKLQGEAYFEVKTNAKNPLIVEAGDIDIKVTGTKFNVRNYENTYTTEVTLLEGLVGIHSSGKISKKEELYRLKPNQTAVYSKTHNKLSVKNTNARQSVYWTDGKLFFENEPITSIFEELERNFNVVIDYNNAELKKDSFSGLFNKEKNVYQILDIIKLSGTFRYTLKNDTIKIN
ncbi:MAG: FecR domain-containing protein [Bacteroidales bacterium]|nr:FecR domain-containing protein [Bacteroidales bacterium]